ncbi:MAG: iron-sulfur cluster assembly scaffold protein [candidate division NC10 bacterium]|nr:iron-sulfur cluster assembly scaffold protein [candidate division NC10 bacterium]
MAALYGDIILEHFRHPRNYGTLPSPDIASEDFNPLCGDRIRIELKLHDGMVEVARFKGDGCAISRAAASILTEMIQGESLERAEGMNQEELLSALKAEIRPSRIKCALLPLNALHAGIAAYRKVTPPPF